MFRLHVSAEMSWSGVWSASVEHEDGERRLAEPPVGTYELQKRGSMNWRGTEGRRDRRVRGSDVRLHEPSFKQVFACIDSYGSVHGRVNRKSWSNTTSEFKPDACKKADPILQYSRLSRLLSVRVDRNNSQCS